MMNHVQDGLVSVHGFLDDIHFSTVSGLDFSRAEAKKSLETWVAKQEGMPEEFLLVPRFAQFLVATLALSDSHFELQLSEMGDWIGWSLSESTDDSHSKNLHLSRVIDFFRSPCLRLWPGFTPTMVKFFSAFYFYTRERTAMKDIAEEFWPISTDFFQKLMKQPTELIESLEVNLGIDLLCWAGKEAPDLAKKFAPIIEEMAGNEILPNKIRAPLCMALSTTAGRFSSQTPNFWAEKALVEFGGNLAGEHRVQLLSTIFANSEGCESSRLIKEVNAVQAKWKSMLGKVEFFRDAAMRSGSFQPFVIKCLHSNNAKLFLDGMNCWYQLDHGDNKLRPEEILITVPFGEKGYFSIMNKQIFAIERDTQSVLEELVRSNNKFLGIAKSIAYADNSDLRIPERIGVPKYHEAVHLERIISESYCPAVFPFKSEPSCQLILDMECNPVQAVQMVSWGRTWPISASLSVPKPDRKISKVAIWSGGGTLTESMESELIEFVFKSAGAAVDVFSPAECLAEEFISAYRDESYDVFWVMSHGEFDHWSPKNVKLQIAQDRATVSLDDLWGITPQGEGRRLLMLNICDGGRFEERGFLPKIGLATGLACSEQATISHLWPVMGFPSATFGIYLAHFLTEDMSYFDAYQNALKAIRKPTSDIAQEFRLNIGSDFEIISSLKRRDEDYSSIEYFGSAAFYQ